MNRLSVVTVNLNNVAGLSRTCQSLFSQSFIDFEFIVIDGGSTDGSIEFLQTHTDKITRWTSEPDSGIYNAMNKGIRAATGEYCLFLNSGDWLVHENILADVFASKPTADIVAGDVYYFDTDRGQIHWQVDSPEVLTAKTLFGGTLPHQATFIKRKLFYGLGFYDESLKIASDWLFFMKALLENEATYQHFRGVISYFAMDGISCDPTTESLPRREQLAILHEKYPRFVPDYERLEQLENESRQWLQSREFAVYRIFRKVGLISLGIWGRRAIRFTNRKLSNQ